MKNRTLKITVYEEKNRQQVLNAGKVFQNVPAWRSGDNNNDNRQHKFFTKQ